MRESTSHRICALVILLSMAIAGLTEFGMGRRPWGVSGQPGLWSGDIWSEHNSQFVADPYSLTHVSHGILFYGILSIALKAPPLPVRLAAAVILESGWEVLENTDMVIDRYRTATISLNYFGDSIVNSMSDIIACLLGFLLAGRLAPRASLAAFVGLELLLAVWIRDNLLINIIMLIAPNDLIRHWQQFK